MTTQFVRGYTVPIKHGTFTGYCRGCRCLKCRVSKSDYQREWARKKRAKLEKSADP